MTKKYNFYHQILPKIAAKNYAPESYSQRTSSKIAPCIIAPHSCSKKLFTKLLPKVVPEINFPKLVPEAALKLFSSTPKLVSKIVPKSGPESSSPKLLLKLLPKIPCKSISESCCFSKQVFLKIVPDSCPKLLPKVVPGRCSSKLFPKAAVQSYYPKAAILQNYTP